jgi:uncharacterized protein with HEPN domain
MKDRSNKLLIDDIHEAITSIETYTKGLTYETFIADKKTMDAVIRNFEIIGEAIKKLNDELKESDKSVPWKKVASFRDILIHDYFAVDYFFVWEIIEHQMPQLKTAIIKLKSKI